MHTLDKRRKRGGYEAERLSVEVWTLGRGCCKVPNRVVKKFGATLRESEGNSYRR